ncbi:MAG: 2,3-bisphosphoglycerate-independent phosphoglycerate mutase [Deltaproteobacteria bacterium]|nr:2,3-bisphosphoglycerate-independent phosphoglycerate mutase [Deltaproteobacteria bacterium]
MNQRPPCILIILDGWGISPIREGNAILQARTPFLDKLTDEYPRTHLRCCGDAVGLPEGIMGNSEVGHLNIGAGRIVYQDLLKIDMAIKDGQFFKNDVLNSVMSKVKANDSTLHLMGLVSDGGVHSQFTHILALMNMAREKGLKGVNIHAILDGRDTPPDSGVKYLVRLQEYISTYKFGTIATVCGRYYAMDRDNRWDRVKKAYRLYTCGEGNRAKDPVEAVKKAYLRDEMDEFVLPIAITNGDSNPSGTVQDNDGIIFFNFRADRARELTWAFTDPTFEFFKRDPHPVVCEFVCMTVYDEKLPLPVAFPSVHMEGILGEVISAKGLRQLRIAETEKYAHVTYFFNGGEEQPFALEDRCLIPSPKDVQTYDLKPEMSAFEVTEEVISRIQSNKYDLIVLNFANMDMVGHTGVLDAAIKACEAVDRCVEKVITAIKLHNGVALITADHGNAEKMIENNGKIHTAHSTNPVPFILVDDARKTAKLSAGILGDIAPTILHIMGIDKPAQMTGTSLFKD